VENAHCAADLGSSAARIGDPAGFGTIGEAAEVCDSPAKRITAQTGSLRREGIVLKN
jgi:hypothetical protein